MSAPLVAIRADGSATIGMGHVVRCLSLAKALDQTGGEAFFIGKNLGGVAAKAVRDQGFEFETLDDSLDEMADREGTLEVVRRRGTQVLLIDHYGIGAASHRFFRQAGVPLAVIDDEIKNPALDCDLILNQNIGVTEEDYADSPARTKLCGVRYAMLREEFLQARRRNVTTKSNDLRLLITLGGSDPDNVTSLALEAARGCAGFREILVVAGPAFSHLESLEQTASQDARARILRAPADMAALMAEADMAITGGGATCYECACLGLPNIMIQIAENQVGICRGMDAARCALFARSRELIAASHLAAGLSRLVVDKAKREDMARRGMALIDGKGARRVAEALMRLTPICH